MPLDPDRPPYSGPPEGETRILTYAEAIDEAYVEEFESDLRVIPMGEDVISNGNTLTRYDPWRYS